MLRSSSSHFLHFVCKIQSLAWQHGIRLIASPWRSSASSFCVSDSSDWRAPSCSTHTVIDSTKAPPKGDVCECVTCCLLSRPPCSKDDANKKRQQQLSDGDATSRFASASILPSDPPRWMRRSCRAPPSGSASSEGQFQHCRLSQAAGWAGAVCALWHKHAAWQSDWLLNIKSLLPQVHTDMLVTAAFGADELKQLFVF